MDTPPESSAMDCEPPKEESDRMEDQASNTTEPDKSGTKSHLKRKTHVKDNSSGPDKSGTKSYLKRKIHVKDKSSEPDKSGIKSHLKRKTHVKDNSSEPDKSGTKSFLKRKTHVKDNSSEPDKSGTKSYLKRKPHVKDKSSEPDKSGTKSYLKRKPHVKDKSPEPDKSGKKSHLKRKTHVKDKSSKSKNQKVSKRDVDYFATMPEEILEKIFRQLSIFDLCLACNRVCKRWNDIISAEKFFRSKKLYYRLKKNIPPARGQVRKIMLKNKMVHHTHCLPGLIRYTQNCLTIPQYKTDNITECLRRHTKYSWADALIKERLPDLVVNGVANPLSVIAALVVISENVGDVQEIIQCLCLPHCQCTTMELLETLYGIATPLLYFKLIYQRAAWSGMHYRLFYALHSFENTSSASHGDLAGATSGNVGQQSIARYGKADASVRMTNEQLRIVNHKCKPGEVIKIVAFAGTGKTTTLLSFAQLRPDMKFLLVVCNKSACENAKTKFPSNVTCKTGHDLAFDFTGRRYMDAQKMEFDLNVYTVSKLLSPRKGDNLFIRSKFVLDTLNHFLASDEQTVTFTSLLLHVHLPFELRNNWNTHKAKIIRPAEKALYVEDATYLWNRMVDLNDKEVPMTHDGYLKQYQLSKPKLLNYDCILIDEAQDLTPAITDILLRQTQTKILVGDPHQQIYSFRGAVNAMSQIQASQIFYLTQSFRFGPEIAQVAASCLEVLKNVKEKTLVGNGQPCKIMGEEVGQVAILARYNYTLFKKAVDKCSFSNSNNKVAFVGGTEAFGFPMLQEIYTLTLSKGQRKKEGRRIANKFINNFRDMKELEKYATATNDMELFEKIKIVEAYHNNLPSHINKILAKSTSNLKDADLLFSTAHMAKGLEFSTVRLMDDFEISFHERNVGHHTTILKGHKEKASYERNLLYVAVTRAKHALQMSQSLIPVLEENGESFQCPMLSSYLENKGIPFKCKETGYGIKPYALTLQQKNLILSSGPHYSQGLYGPTILSEDMCSFSELLGDKDGEQRSGKRKVYDVTDDDDDSIYNISWGY